MFLDIISLKHIYFYMYYVFTHLKNYAFECSRGRHNKVFSFLSDIKRIVFIMKTVSGSCEVGTLF